MNLQGHKTPQNAQKRCWWHRNIIDLTGLLPTYHIIIIQWLTGVYHWGNGGCYHLNSSKKAKYLKCYSRKVESTEEMANFGNYPGDFILFHTLIRRQGYTVQNLKSPGLSGRVDSTALFAFSNVNVQSVPSQVVWTFCYLDIIINDYVIP